ncbi:phosphonate ABC transporter ATP-binding protein [Chloroflexota bacterium]
MIKLSGVSHCYPVRAGAITAPEHALENINLEVSKGERMVLLGASGSGKSTLLRSTNLSIKPTEGQVFIDGTDITSMPPNKIKQARRKIGVISQSFNLVESASVLKNVLLGRLGYSTTLSSILGKHSYEDIDIAKDAISRVDLQSYTQKRVSDLSGGEKQRVAIARALTQQPTILLADEPVSSLDPKLMKEIMDLITGVCGEKGMTLIASLHFLELAKAYATRMVGLRNGQIVVDTTPDELTDKDIIDIYGETEDWVLYGKRGF